jgi:hypothetical protein
MVDARGASVGFIAFASGYTTFVHSPSDEVISYPGTAECDQLVALADAMPALAERRRHAFATWYRDLYALAADPAVETTAGERALDACALELRRLWMATAHEYADVTYRSPLAGTARELPASPPMTYGYERSIEANAIEERIAAYRPVPPGWQAEHLLFSSGMAALTGCFTALPGLLGTAPGETLALAAVGAYYETLAALELAHGIAPAATENTAALIAQIRHEPPQAVFVEPIVYNVDLTPVDVFAVADAVAACASPPALIIDSTLVGPALPMARLMTHLRFANVPFIVQISSGLKLDQAGLELANAGMLSIYVPEQSDSAQTLDGLVARLRTVRRLAGTALPLDSIALLDVPFFLDPVTFYDYTSAVFTHNAALAQALSEGGVFARVAHPTRHQAAALPWSVAPFVMCHLRDDTAATARALETIVETEALRRGPAFVRGGSFGFRGHRFEAIELEGDVATRFLKSLSERAMGPRAPASPSFSSKLPQRRTLQHWSGGLARPKRAERRRRNMHASSVSVVSENQCTSRCALMGSLDPRSPTPPQCVTPVWNLQQRG